MVRIVVEAKSITRVSLVPVTRDASNNVLMLDPTTGEGARLVRLVEGVSDVPLTIVGQEVVLLDGSSTPTEQ